MPAPSSYWACVHYSAAPRTRRIEQNPDRDESPTMKARIATVLTMVLTALLAIGCSHDAIMPDVEVARVASPDLQADAVLTEANPGATASFIYRIRIVPHGADWRSAPSAAELYGATRSAQAYGVDLHWQDANSVRADYLQGRVMKPASAAVSVAGRAVTLQLRSGVSNPAAPAGGMAPEPKQAR